MSENITLWCVFQLGIIHCDLKPGNLMLVKESESQTGVCIKIGDFGLSKVLPTRTNNIMNTNIGGTIAWAAPECLVPGAVCLRSACACCVL